MTDKLTKKDRIEGRVAQILNARELVINIGEEKGVYPEMRFAVLSGEPLEVIDPETGEVLDVVDREKVRVEATEVRPKITICKTYRTTHVPAGGLYSATTLGVFGEAFRPPRTITETLEAKDSSLPPPLSQEESYVKISDRVIQVMDD